MSAHADTIRQALMKYPYRGEAHHLGAEALAALDALEAERDQLADQVERLREMLKDAEADRTRLAIEVANAEAAALTRLSDPNWCKRL